MPTTFTAAPALAAQAKPHFAHLSVIGCGLMGASFALAAKAAGVVDRITGYSPSASTRDQALALGVIEHAANSAAEAVQGADLVVLAVPVAATSSTFAALAGALAPTALLMDMGSTKQDVVAAARAHLGARLPCFVPAHPIAGKEKAGVAHADAHLYRGKRVILTPLDSSERANVQAAAALWRALGSEVLEMDAARHDKIFAAVSHLPHLLAFALVRSVAEQAEGAEYLRLAGSGFRDSTRIAASPSWVWRDILFANQTEVRAQLQHLRQALSDIEQTLNDPAALETLIEKASTIREHMRFDAPFQKDERSS